MTIEQMANEAHLNAVAHGWWDDEPEDDVVLALIHSEWSEALEEARNGRPMVYGLAIDSDDKDTQYYVTDMAEIAERRLKPEGIAVELIDGVIRILDYFGKIGAKFKNNDTGEESELESLWDDAEIGERLKVWGVGTLVLFLHKYISDAYQEEKTDIYSLLAAATMAMGWVSVHGVDPFAVLRLKHEYNKGRPYRHGKKF